MRMAQTTARLDAPVERDGVRRLDVLGDALEQHRSIENRRGGVVEENATLRALRRDDVIRETPFRVVCDDGTNEAFVSATRSQLQH